MTVLAKLRMKLTRNMFIGMILMEGLQKLMAVKSKLKFCTINSAGPVMSQKDELGKSVIQLVYDEFGREIERRVTLSLSSTELVPDPLQSLTLVVETSYYANNLIQSKVIKQLKTISKSSGLKLLYTMNWTE